VVLTGDPATETGSRPPPPSAQPPGPERRSSPARRIAVIVLVAALALCLVRSLLVPSLVSLFGKWNWYLPDWVAKVLRVEPSVLHDENEVRDTPHALQPNG
jgi:hypothetical protein